MDLLKEAKTQMNEIEKGLNKATAALGIDDSQAASTDEPSNTPATTEAGDAAGAVDTAVKPKDGGKTKLSLAQRKNVRDEFENEKAALEGKLSELLKVPWTIFVDTVPVLSYAEGDYANVSPGSVFRRYFEAAVDHVERYVEKHGEDGRETLNARATHHIVTLEPDENVGTSGGDIQGGKLRLLFNPTYLGTNVNDAIEKLGAIVSDADAAALGPSKLPLLARSSIKHDYEDKIGELLATARKMVEMPTLQFVPNFEANFAKLKEHSKSKRSELQHDWVQRIGEVAYAYFEDGLVSGLRWKQFGDDDMLQEGFREGVETGKVELQVVDALQKRNYNECAIEAGVLYLRTLPQYWFTNVGDVLSDIMDLL